MDVLNWFSNHLIAAIRSAGVQIEKIMFERRDIGLNTGETALIRDKTDLDYFCSSRSMGLKFSDSKEKNEKVPPTVCPDSLFLALRLL